MKTCWSFGIRRCIHDDNVLSAVMEYGMKMWNVLIWLRLKYSRSCFEHHKEAVTNGRMCLDWPSICWLLN